MTVQTRIVFEVAGIVFAISSDQPAQALWLEDAYQDFLCTKEPQVTIHAHYGVMPPLALRDEDRLFDSEVIWSLYRIGGQEAFVLRSPVSGPDPYRVALFDADFRRGEVYSCIPETDGEPDDLLPNPLDYPLSEVLMVRLLARGRGLMVHACGIDDGGRGYLFAGNSTHGKTTTARLWRDRATVLNDDRIVLRQRQGRIWMYGTPWHGDHTGVAPQGVPLDKIFFLQHAGHNQARRVEGVAAASRLLTRCYPPLWDEEGMRFSLDFCAQVVRSLPCYELGFLPDERVVEYVRCVK
jgi:hypothetical protein